MAQTRFSIPLGKLADDMKERLEQRARYITLAAFNSVVLKSPVATGRFRANWNVSYGTPDYHTSGSTFVGPVDPTRHVRELQKASSLPVGGVTFLANGLPYAAELERGSSKQSPQGMIRLTALEFSQKLEGK